MEWEVISVMVKCNKMGCEWRGTKWAASGVAQNGLRVAWQTKRTPTLMVISLMAALALIIQTLTIATSSI